MEIKGNLTIIQDSKGSDYLAIDVEPNICNYYNDFLINKGFTEEVSLKLRRDNGHYHITIINVMQWGSLKKKGLIDEILLNYNNKEYIFNSFGIGHAEKDNNNSYFIILENLQLQKMREHYSLPIHDFHITLAFKEKDVFGVPKNKDSCLFTNNDILKKNKINP